MIKPRKIEYEVGTDVYGRTVLLQFVAGYRGAFSHWAIRVLAGNGRDSDQYVMGLTPEVILAMAEVLMKEAETRR